MSEEAQIHPDAAKALWWNVGYSTALLAEPLATEVPPEYQESFERGQAAARKKSPASCEDGLCPE